MAASTHHERELAAAAAAELLPFALLAPSELTARLVSDGIHHPGQLPVVLELMRLFRPVVCGQGAAAGGGGCEGGPSRLLCQLQRIMGLEAGPAPQPSGAGGAAGGASRGLPLGPELSSDGQRQALVALVQGCLGGQLAGRAELVGGLVVQGLQRCRGAGAGGGLGSTQVRGAPMC